MYAPATGSGATCNSAAGMGTNAARTMMTPP